jgi:hypothetical protein
VQIEPAQGERLAQGMGIGFLQRRLEYFPATPKTEEAGFRHFTAETDRLIAFLAREPGELAPVFVAARIMGEEIAHCFDPEPAQLGDARARDPFHFP